MNSAAKVQAVKLLERAHKLSAQIEKLNAEACDALDAARASAPSLVDFLTGLNEALCDASSALMRDLPDEVEEDS